MVAAAGSGWPALGTEVRTWVPDPASRGPVQDRLLGDYRSAVVPAIARQPLDLAAAARSATDAARTAIVEMQRSAGRSLGALVGALLRSESVASSKIEHLSSSQVDVALAAFGAARPSSGGQVRASARAVAATIAAMHAATSMPLAPRISAAEVLQVHGILMAGDRAGQAEAGRLRSVPNWIGGSDYSPRGALFVPPHPSALVAGLDDLVAFCNRSDVDPVALAAIAHAQFETLHPFSDGNGRTGRALVHLLWRHHGIAPAVVVPVSTVLLADVDSYFGGLTAYRQGDVDGWVSQFAAAAVRAALAGRSLAEDVEELRAAWAHVTRARKGSLRRELVDVVLRNPVLDHATLAQQGLGRAKTTVYRAVERLVDDGVLVEVTGQGRHRVWIAPAVFELLEQFERHVGHRQLPRV